jgi:hypothetical protein
MSLSAAGILEANCACGQRNGCDEKLKGLYVRIHCIITTVVYYRSRVIQLPRRIDSPRPWRKTNKMGSHSKYVSIQPASHHNLNYDQYSDPPTVCNRLYYKKFSPHIIFVSKYEWVEKIQKPLLPQHNLSSKGALWSESWRYNRSIYEQVAIRSNWQTQFWHHKIYTGCLRACHYSRHSCSCEDGIYVQSNNAVFWDITPCGFCKNRRLAWMYRLHRQGNKNRRAR